MPPAACSSRPTKLHAAVQLPAPLAGNPRSAAGAVAFDVAGAEVDGRPPGCGAADRTAPLVNGSSRRSGPLAEAGPTEERDRDKVHLVFLSYIRSEF